MNWISATGFKPYAAMPIAVPIIDDSARGVSKILSGNFSKSPSVILKTPPSLPTSSPIRTTSLSFSISCLRARFIDCTMFKRAIDSPESNNKDASAALSLRLLRSTYAKKYASLEALLRLASAILLAEFKKLHFYIRFFAFKIILD